MDQRASSNRRLPVDPAALMRAARHDRRSRPVLAVLLIAISVWALWSEHNRTRTAQVEWGDGIETWVTTAELDAGQVLRAGDVRNLSLPPIALPDDAVVDEPLGRRLTDAVGAGEIVRVGRLGDGDASVNTALVGSGRGAITLTGRAPHVSPGDHVDLYGLLDGAILAHDAEVIALVDDVPVVAVETADLADVIMALSFGDVVPVLVD